MDDETKAKPLIQTATNKGSDPLIQPVPNVIDGATARWVLSRVSDDDFFSILPTGYRFNPTEVELIMEYLMRKIEGQDLPRSKIHEVNLYRSDPEHLAERYKPSEENEWYVFTPRYKKYKGGRRPNRATGEGYWKATGADKPIKHNNAIIGYRKALVYYRGKPTKGTKTNWMMHEYKMNSHPSVPPQSSSDTMRLDDWVLCKIYQKASQPLRRRSKTNEEQNGAVEEEIMQGPNILTEVGDWFHRDDHDDCMAAAMDSESQNNIINTNFIPDWNPDDCFPPK